MRTRSQSRNSNRQQQQVNPTFVEPFNLIEPIPVVTMDDNRTMAQLLEAPTVSYEDAIVVPEITADNFELKHGLLTLVQNKQFFGHDKEVPHLTSVISNKNNFYEEVFPNVPSTRSAAGGNFLDKMPRDCLRIIESKSKVRNSRNKPVVSKVSSSSSTPGISPDVSELKDTVKALLLEKKNQTQALTPVKAVEESCVTCGGTHSYRNCPATNGNVYRDNIQEYVSQAAATNFNQGNTGYRAPIANQIRPPGFPPVQNNKGNNQNRYNQNQGNNYNQSSTYQPPVNQGQIYRTPINQPPVHQAPPYQAPTPQTQGVTKNDFESYVKANDAVMRNLQDQNQNLQNQMTNLTDMLSKFVNSNTASTSGSGTLPLIPYKPKGELTLRVGKEAITFNLDQTSRYSSNYDDMTANRIDVIEMACEEYSQEVLGFSDCNFLEDSMLEDDPTSPEVDDSYYDPEGDILLLESFLNDDPSPPPNQENYLPEIQKELKVCVAKTVKSSIDEPPKVELKDLLPHLEYAF
ncbi:hypothetical protein Tco_1000702 [Tanacetum coccineum]